VICTCFFANCVNKIDNNKLNIPITSVVILGINNNIEEIPSIILIRIFTLKLINQPSMAEANTYAPINEVIIAKIILNALPSNKSSGPYTKIKGITNATAPIFIAFSATLIGEDFDIPAAAKAAKATGGVNADKQAK